MKNWDALEWVIFLMVLASCVRYVMTGETGCAC